MDEEEIMYLAFSLLVVLIVFAFLSSFGKGWSLLAAILAVITAVIIIMINWADFIIFPFFTKTFGITFQPARDYNIIKTQDAIVKNVNGLFYATGFLTANVFSYSFKEEQNDQDIESKLLAAPDNWEKAVMSTNFPFKFHVLSAGNDIQQVRDEFEGKRSYQEFQLSRMQQKEGAANESAITEIRRNISVIQAKIDRISRGEKPVSSIMYIETTAVGVSEKAAVDNLTAQIKQLQISMSSLDLQISRVVGRELYLLFKFNFSLPWSIKEVESQFSKEG